MFTIGSSGLTLINSYPAMQCEFDEIYVHDLWMGYRKWTGESVGNIFPFEGGAPGSEEWLSTAPPMITQLRPLFHNMLYHQLQRFGIDITYGKRVMEYYEDAERSVGGVITDNGEKIEADLVIAADGLNSRSQVIIPTSGSKAKPTRRSVFRCAMPLETAIADPLVNEYFGLKDGKSPLMQIWPGPDVHCVVLSYVDKHGQNGRMCYGIAFREPEGQEPRNESWQNTVTNEDVLAVLERTGGWSDAMKALVKTTPPGHTIAWPLNQRNPNPCWHSPAARVLQLGDSAHPFLPTSGNGATQAIEDGITIAACLHHAGKDKIPLAVRTHNLLRFDRVSCAQLLGFANAERFQKADWAAVKNDPSKLQPKVPRWIWSLNPEKYANANYAAAAASLEGGPAFTNTNIPPGYTPQPWTIDEVEQLQREGKHVELRGDWS